MHCCGCFAGDNEEAEDMEVETNHGRRQVWAMNLFWSVHGLGHQPQTTTTQRFLDFIRLVWTWPSGFSTTTTNQNFFSYLISLSQVSPTWGVQVCPPPPTTIQNFFKFVILVLASKIWVSRLPPPLLCWTTTTLKFLDCRSGF